MTNKTGKEGHCGGTIEPGHSVPEIIQCENVLSPEQAEALSRKHTQAILDGGMIFVECESRVERVRRLMKEADADVGRMVWEVNEKLLAIQTLLSEIDECRSTRPGVQSLVQELKPQIDRWQGIVQGVGNRQAGA